MKILYLGNDSGTSLQRINAFERLGHEIIVVNPENYALVSNRFLYKWLFETGGVVLVWLVCFRLKAQLKNVAADVVWINGGDLVSSSFVIWLKKRFGLIVNYNNDLPFGNRDKKRWAHYLKSIQFYDLLLVRSNTDMELPLHSGAKKVVAMYMLADEVVHKRVEQEKLDGAGLSSDVLFVGTWFPERGAFISELIKRGVPITFYGDRWDKAPEWEEIKDYWRGDGLDGKKYTLALQSAKICLGLVSEENGDLHTRRSMEVPAVKSVLCAKRTWEHQLLYQEGSEAFFWDDAMECAAICKKLISDNELRATVAQAGFERFKKNGQTNEKFLAGALAHLGRVIDAK